MPTGRYVFFTHKAGAPPPPPPPRPSPLLLLFNRRRAAQPVAPKPTPLLLLFNRRQHPLPVVPRATPLLLLFTHPPFIPTDLLEAVIARLKSTAVVATQVSAITSDEATVGTAFPYLVCLEVEGPTEYQSQAADNKMPYDDHPTVQVTVVGTGKETVRILGRIVDATLNDAPLVFSTGILNWFRRSVQAHDELDPERGPNGADVWRRTFIYDALIQRTI